MELGPAGKDPWTGRNDWRHGKKRCNSSLSLITCHIIKFVSLDNRPKGDGQLFVGILRIGISTTTTIICISNRPDGYMHAISISKRKSEKKENAGQK